MIVDKIVDINDSINHLISQYTGFIPTNRRFTDGLTNFSYYVLRYLGYLNLAS